MTVRLREISDASVLGRSVWIGNCAQEVFAGDIDRVELERLVGLWRELPLDLHLRDHGRYRERRYAKLIFRAAGGELHRTEDTEFFQPRRYNPVNTGIRKFKPIERCFLGSPLVDHLIRHFASRFARELSAAQLELNLHQVRIIGRQSEPGYPTPEGVHQDGVDFSCQILFGRHNVNGGESIIYDVDRKPLLGATMSDPLDFYCFRDPDIYHSVTPVLPACAGDWATRDVLGIDFSRTRRTKDED